jgi:hypothetical protein
MRPNPNGDIPIDRIRRIASALPAVTERMSHGEPTFFINDKKTFVMTVNDHHGDGIFGMWLAAGPGEQQARMDENPAVFFRPPYVGHRGWLGVRLDTTPPIDEETLIELITEAWCLIAPQKLVAAWEQDTRK